MHIVKQRIFRMLVFGHQKSSAAVVLVMLMTG
jgi:hypothetical protein